MNRSLCLHGHFYQPPRENPWLEEVELQDSARPYHDWNERISAECYQRNAASRILDADRRIVDIVNNYARISFNFGPTLLSWMERHQPDLHGALVEADRESRSRFGGHGSALAQVYNHLIMPLANSRDKRTQVLWGLRDFEHRFGRKPEGMWLAETAVDLETLDILAENGVRFTLLAPRQAHRIRPHDGDEWEDVGESVDPKTPYLCRLPSGRSISLFFYDGPISQDIAFSGLLNDGEAFARRLVESFDPGRQEPQLVHIATDGETYGHHHRHGEMALSYCLHHIESEGGAELTVYGQYLEHHPPRAEVEIHERSSWSCVHGVERWRSDCGCHSGTRPEWNQAWRGPLRDALDGLREALSPLYERELGALFEDPWSARDDYVAVILDRSEASVRSFLEQWSRRELSAEEKVKALKLLELQRHAMLMYTSCGWFFDEISGIETVQVLQYADRAIQLAGAVTDEDLESPFVESLRAAPSNVLTNGAEVFEKYVKPAALDLHRVGAHYAVSSLFEEYTETVHLFAYTARSEVYDRRETGRQRLALGKAVIRSDITWEETEIDFAVLHLGDHNINGGIREYPGPEQFREMHQEVMEAFLRSDLPEVIRLQDKHFGSNTYSLWHLFRDEQRAVLDRIRYTTLDDVETSLRKIYQDNYALMNFLQNLHIPLPRAFRFTAEYTVGEELKGLFRQGEPDLERAEQLLQEVQKWPLRIDQETVGFVAASWVRERLEEWEQDPGDLAKLQRVERALDLFLSASVDLDLWQVQNLYFRMGRKLHGAMLEEKDREYARGWLDAFGSLGDLLGVRVGP